MLDVLVIESIPGAGADKVKALVSAGHRVHSCASPAHHDANAAPGHDALPVCVAVTDGVCPLDDGIDVALLCRHPLAGRPRLAEAGVLCALRRKVPLVIDAPETAEAFEPWASAFVHGDVVAACAEAADDGYDDLRSDIARRIAPTLATAGLSSTDITCRFHREGPRLLITLIGPEVSRPVEQALGVRVLDAVRAAPSVYGQVNVAFEVAVPA